MRTTIRSIVVLTVAVLAVPGVAAAATRPAATTGGAAKVTPTSATLTGSVNPEGSATRYQFEFGTTRSYGGETGPTAAGSGKRTVAAAADLTGLQPARVYHYRLVASNTGGTTYGRDRTFRTRPQPLGFTLAAMPNPVPFGGATTLVGQLTGTGSAGRSVVLQQKAFPYTAAFADVGNPLVTDAQGRFSFPVLGLGINTQYRVTTADHKATSAIVIVGSQVVTRLRISSHRVHSHRLVRFAGSVRPREDGALYAVQRRRRGVWVTVAGSSLRPYRSDRSRFAKRVRIVHSGLYRIYVGVADGAHVPGTSSEQPIRVIPRR